MSTHEKLVDEFAEAAIRKYKDEQYEYADPNRECADYARAKFKRMKKKILTLLRGKS